MKQILSYKSNEIIKISNKDLTLHKAISSAEFGSKTVLVDSPWDYTEMWLKRNRKEDAVFYWNQARDFFEAAKSLPLTSAPLPIFYAFMNGVKALLTVKGKDMSINLSHGIGRINEEVTERLLQNERMKFFHSRNGNRLDVGLFGLLAEYLNDSFRHKEIHSLKELLYNLPYIHRAYSLTFPMENELFIPIKKPRWQVDGKCQSAQFVAEVDPRYATPYHLNSLNKQFSWDNDGGDTIIKSCFLLELNKNKEKEMQNLKKFHNQIRKHTFYILGAQRLWYIKKDTGIPMTSISITYAAMHKLSELVRYNPIFLHEHLNSEHNWLITEFIRNAPYQFFDEIACELTGEEFMMPGIAFGR
ncbi:YaaC family protein [Priestia megaterium]|uniref:YaaC family protein n=1 Tax=Priestia megaterium TaxID=1404 RepID=UPI002D80D9E7|nr:YaaC family protein [Priestia megaterium]MEB4872116.1 YaaC family protein [Priestia megaterium]